MSGDAHTEDVQIQTANPLFTEHLISAASQNFYPTSRMPMTRNAAPYWTSWVDVNVVMSGFGVRDGLQILVNEEHVGGAATF